MSRELNGSNQYLWYPNGPIIPVSPPTTPFSMAGWVFPTVADANHSVMSIPDSATNANYYYIRLRRSSQAQVAESWHRASTGSAIAQSTTNWTNNAWNHVTGVFESNSARHVYLDGGSKGSETATTVDDPGADRVGVGALVRSSTAGFTAGDIAECAIWGVALTDAEASALGAGLSPLLVRPDGLLAYWPIIGRLDPETPWFGPYELDLINGPTVADHPRIIHMPGLKRRAALSGEAPEPPPPPPEGEVPAQITIRGLL